MSIPQPIHDLLQAYFEGDTSLETTQAIEAWLKEDPANLRRFAEYGVIEDMLFSEQQSIDSEAVHTVMAELEPSGATDVLDSAMQIQWTHSSGTTSHSKALGVIGYVGRQVLRRYAVGIVSVAAIFVFAAILLFVFRGEGDGPAEREVVIDESPSSAEERLIVATLTAEHDANWQGDFDYPAPKPGERLQAGRSLTLTQGFAEITTVDGAFVILEAPATIELLDNSNAVHLHAGKLVGICNTPASKGFTVYTRSTRIIDISTEFGVSLDSTGELEVHVLSGEVAVETLDADDESETLTLKQAQALRVSPDLATITRMAAAPAKFARDLSEEQVGPASRYASAIMADQPVAYYRFESFGQDGLTRNTVGDRYHAKAYGPVSLKNGLAGSALSLPATAGQAAYVKLSDFSALNGAEQYTLECWVKPTKLHLGAVISLMHAELDRLTHVASSLQLSQPGSGGVGNEGSYIRFVHRNPPAAIGGVEASGMDAYRPGQWVHLVAVVTPQAARLYVNNELVDTQPSPGRMVDIQTQTLIGVTHPKLDMTDRRQFDGLIDEVAIYATALSETDISRHYQLMQPLVNK